MGDELTHKPLDRAPLDAFAEQTRDPGLVVEVGCGPGQATAPYADAALAGLVAFFSIVHMPTAELVVPFRELHRGSGCTHVAEMWGAVMSDPIRSRP